MRKQKWRKYSFEFLSIFIAVISAFALNNWNENRKDNIAESKILSEIAIGIAKDQKDVDINIRGHEHGIKSCDFWRKIINGEQPNLDTLVSYYFILTRDFTSIQNTSGYETLKSRGFELMDNDSLRSKIISLYEFDYQSLRKLEEEYHEMQFQENYFSELNNAIAPHFIFDTDGNIIGINLPLQLKKADKKLLLSYIWKIKTNRQFILKSYEEVKNKIGVLKEEIDEELN